MWLGHIRSPYAAPAEAEAQTDEYTSKDKYERTSEDLPPPLAQRADTGGAIGWSPLLGRSLAAADSKD
jgi:hypothetical protein